MDIVLMKKFLSCLSLILWGITNMPLAAQQSAEANEVVYLDYQTPRGVKTHTITQGKSVVGVKEKGKTVVRGRVHAITDSTLQVGPHIIPRRNIEYFQGNLGRKQLNLLILWLPTALLAFCIIFGGFFLAVEIAGAFWLARTLIGGVLMALGVLGVYLFIPALALWIDSAVRFFVKLRVPEPWHFRNDRMPSRKDVKS